MKFALVNPKWHFEGSIYFGCQDEHLPLEFGYAQALLRAHGHEAEIFDANIEGWSAPQLKTAVSGFAPDVITITSAPTYLFWRCPQPELRVPAETRRLLEDLEATTVLVGPHASTTPRAAVEKTGVDVAILGECEEVLPKLAQESWKHIEGLAYRDDGRVVVQGGPQSADMATLPALKWPDHFIERHTHHHHRFDGGDRGFGAEMEASRGCPYDCTFCAKENFRDKYRKRPLETLLRELDTLLAQGVGYIYFVDEIFLPNRPLLEALRDRPVQFGVQTRIDLWKPQMLDLLGEAGCVSIEAGVESISDLGRFLLNKRCKLDADQLQALLVRAKQTVPFVQASLLDSQVDDPDAVEKWRQELLDQGVWANKPVPMFPYPGSPSYTELWGLPDEQAWERAHAHYLAQFENFSDIQDERPEPLTELEAAATRGGDL
jgi:anaerobic magnesium-protoporphyrin IX monomethyl ester cyclase